MDDDIEDIKSLQNIISKNRNESINNNTYTLGNSIKNPNNNNNNNPIQKLSFFNNIKNATTFTTTTKNVYNDYRIDEEDDDDELELDIDEDEIEPIINHVNNNNNNNTNTNTNSNNSPIKNNDNSFEIPQFIPDFSLPPLIVEDEDGQEEEIEDFNRVYKRLRTSTGIITPPITTPTPTTPVHNFQQNGFEEYNDYENSPSNSPSQPNTIDMVNHQLDLDKQDLDMLSELDVEEALKLNLQYQTLLKNYLAKIEEAQTRNTSLLKALKNQSSITVASGRSKQIKEEKRSGVAYFSYDVHCDGVVQTFYPTDNLDSDHIRKTYNNMPLYFKVRKWTKNDTNILCKSIYERNVQKLKQQVSMQALTLVDHRRAMDDINSKDKKDLEIIPLSADEFAMICVEQFPHRSPDELLLRWKNREHPAINKQAFTKEEELSLLTLCKKYSNRQWQQIANEMGTNRTPLACLSKFQRTHNMNLMRVDWSRDEDEILRNAYAIHGDRNWQTIAEYLPYRTGQQCLHRWQKTLDPHIKKGKWSFDEDELLRNAVKLYGYGNWVLIKQHVPGRTDMQCRERWCNVIDPNISKGPFSAEEDRKLTDLIAKHGIGKWSAIATELGTRTDNQCWRRWKQINPTTSVAQYQEKVSKKKKVTVSNFVGREKERSALTVDEILQISEPPETPNNIITPTFSNGGGYLPTHIPHDMEIVDDDNYDDDLISQDN